MNTKNIIIPKIEDLTILKVILSKSAFGSSITFHVIDKNNIVYEMYTFGCDVRDLSGNLLYYLPARRFFDENKFSEYQDLLDALKSKCKEIFKDVWC